MPYTPANPSPKAVARVKEVLPVPTQCPNCGGAVELVGNEVIYGRPYGDWPWMYRCVSRACDSYVGLHPLTHLPLGTLANRATREARKKAKAAFNPMWQRGGMTRTDAYTWLAKQLGLPAGKAHIGWFDVATCEKVVALCSAPQIRF